MIYTSSVIYKYKLVHIPWSLRKWFANTPPFTLFKNMRYLLQRLQKLLPRSLCMFMITKQSREGRGHFTPPSCDPYFSLTHRNSFSNDFFLSTSTETHLQWLQSNNPRLLLSTDRSRRRKFARLREGRGRGSLRLHDWAKGPRVLRLPSPSWTDPSGERGDLGGHSSGRQGGFGTVKYFFQSGLWVRGQRGRLKSENEIVLA